MQLIELPTRKILRFLDRRGLSQFAEGENKCREIPI